MRKVFIVVGKSLLGLLSIAGTALLMFACWLVWHFEYGLGLPDESKLAALSPTERICSTSGQRVYMPLAEVPPLIRKAVLAYKDRDFYDRPRRHPLAAYVLAVAHGRREPWSSISNSVAKCLVELAPECCRGPGLDRMIGEVILVGRLERAMSRDRILEIHLNEAYFGRGAYGVVAASTAYFGKPPERLSIDEVAIIAALTRNWGNLQRTDRAIDHRNFVIDRMLGAGLINSAEAASARERPLDLFEAPTSKNGTQGPL